MQTLTELASQRKDLPIWIAAGVLLLLCALLTMLLLSRYSPVFTSNDGAQYLSTAKYIVNGDGLKTDILFFDTHYRSGDMPAVQTVWPPGFPLLIAATSAATGVGLHQSAFLVGLIGLLGVGPLVFAILRHTACTRHAALLGACLCLGFAHSWIYPLVISTETVFVLLTLASLYFVSVQRSIWRVDYWVLAGAMAGGAFLMRYTGVFHVAAVGLWLVKEWLWGTSNLKWRQVVAFSIVPALVIGGVFVANYLLVGSITSRSGGDAGLSLLEAVLAFRWPLADLMGYLPEGFFSDRSAYIGLALFFFGCAFYIFRERGQLLSNTGTLASQPVLQISLIYIAVTVAYMLYLTWGAAPGIVVARYLAPLVPFAVVSLFLFTERLPPVNSFATAGAIVLIAIVFEVGQANNAARLIELQKEGARIASYLSKSYDEGGTLRDYLREATDNGSVFSNEPQVLSYYLNRPTLGPPDDRDFTTQVFDAARVKRLIEKYTIKLVVFFPNPPLARPPTSPKAPQIFQELATGQIPIWLKLEYSSDFMRTYRPVLNK
ncbi:MAG: glycosyltransferase family 39 protein [Gammaproteobacteria bacterium]|nr:glycosyltransferase family 39 protein [Gammaproteobacteria bacterium]